MSLAPWSVGDLRDHGLHGGAVEGPAVVEGDRIGDVAEVPEVREYGDRTPGAAARPFPHEVPDRIRQRDVGGAEVVRSLEARERRAPARPEPPLIEHGVEFVEVEHEHEHAIAERVLAGFAAPVPDPPAIQAASRSRSRGGGRLLGDCGCRHQA